MRKKKKMERPIVHDQWIEVTVVDGKTVSTFYPPNKEFEKERLDLDIQPTLIYRRLNFVHGVPREYAWTNPTPSVTRLGGLFLHRVKIEDWPAILELERVHGNGHVMPSPNPQPRPEAYGPCPCPECVAERETP
jgi:hypothetical protein